MPYKAKKSSKYAVYGQTGCLWKEFRYFFMYDKLVSNEIVVPRRWGSETLEFGIKQVYMGQISIVKRERSWRFRRRANACNVSFVIKSAGDDEGLTLET